jgi:hypothetical protein
MLFVWCLWYVLYEILLEAFLRVTGDNGVVRSFLITLRSFLDLVYCVLFCSCSCFNMPSVDAVPLDG